MAASFLSHAGALALRVSFSRAMQQHVPAYFLHVPATTPARSHRLLDAAVGVLVDTVIGLLRIALWAAFLAVILAVSLLALLLILFVSCAVAIVVHLDWSRASGSRERRLAVLAFISVFLLTVALVLMLFVILAVVDGEE
jgi:hypothetical protein